MSIYIDEVYSKKSKIKLSIIINVQCFKHKFIYIIMSIKKINVFPVYERVCRRGKGLSSSFIQI